ncbi:Acylphosphatase [uncultured archaeon]|nr:Acylphosphatase [uncultured archaeon]
MQKCYNVAIVGKVQDVGLRAVIEYAGRLLDLSGLVFNAKDGSVRIICSGESSDIIEFSKEIKARGEQRGAIIQDIKKQEIPVVLDLPYPFSRVLADEDTDIGRKLDKGNELLGNLPEIKNTLSAFVIKQDTHNQHLEKILEKLAER